MDKIWDRYLSKSDFIWPLWWGLKKTE